MKFITAVSTIETDTYIRRLWEVLKTQLHDIDGCCYYQHPIVGMPGDAPPDIAVLAEGYRPVILRKFDKSIDELSDVEGDTWTVSGEEVPSPIVWLDDYRVEINHLFDRQRSIRGRLKPLLVLAFSSISREQFIARFGDTPLAQVSPMWRDIGTGVPLESLNEPLTQEEWRAAKAAFQGFAPARRVVLTKREEAQTLGEAIKVLRKEIGLLDDEQQEIAIQIPPGPQRIRGLAGTGKTVLLAMKAANIHRRDPTQKILFTFHTQSLYNQTKRLISEFFRAYSNDDPDWDAVHIRHSWGSRFQLGVYSDLCRRLGVKPMNLNEARSIDPQTPLRACYQTLAEKEIEPVYDYVLVDEAQDFPAEVFRVLFRLSREPHRIYWAYDELQSLASVEIPGPGDLFGYDESGEPLVSLDGEYPGPLDKDFVLHRSYRCPQEVLMLAHAIGLGIHSPRGCVQMLSDPKSWEAVGYTITKGVLETGSRVEIYRDPQNSPNPLASVYKGNQPVVTVASFADREEELEHIAKSVANDVKVEGVPPHEIVVVYLDARRAKGALQKVQQHLLRAGVTSTVPGFFDPTSDFGEEGSVTLSTVWRAKGNEAFVVYIAAFDATVSFAEEIEARNSAFTAISRSKAWVRLSGSGPRMQDGRREIKQILDDIPYFRFTFPDMEEIKKLDAKETTRRRREVKKAEDLAANVMNLDDEVLKDLSPEKLRSMIAKLKGVADEIE